MAIRYAMIGGGPGALIGEAHRVAASVSGFELVAGAFSSDPEKSRAQAVKAGLAPERGYPDWFALISDAKALALDAVVIVTPNHLHARQADAALNAGLHVVCDKPLCHGREVADELVRAASGKVFGVTYTYAGYAALQGAARLIADGRIGALRLVQADFIQDWLALPIEQQGVGMAAWRLDPARSGPAGATADIGTHIFHMAELVTGQQPVALSADLTAMVPGRALDDTGLIRLRYANGARGVLTVSQSAASSGGGVRFSAMGDEGGVQWSIDQPHQLRMLKRGAPAEILEIPTKGPLPEISGAPSGFLNAFADLYRRFAAAMRGEAVAYPNVAEGARGVAFINAAVASSSAGGAWTEL